MPAKHFATRRIDHAFVAKLLAQHHKVATRQASKQVAGSALGPHARCDRFPELWRVVSITSSKRPENSCLATLRVGGCVIPRLEIARRIQHGAQVPRLTLCTRTPQGVSRWLLLPGTTGQSEAGETSSRDSCASAPTELATIAASATSGSRVNDCDFAPNAGLRQVAPIQCRRTGDPLIVTGANASPTSHRSRWREHRRAGQPVRL